MEDVDSNHWSTCLWIKTAEIAFIEEKRFWKSQGLPFWHGSETNTQFKKTICKQNFFLKTYFCKIMLIYLNVNICIYARGIFIGVVQSWAV